MIKASVSRREVYSRRDANDGARAKSGEMVVFQFIPTSLRISQKRLYNFPPWLSLSLLIHSLIDYMPL
jgi:hypothetical protein